eukprot:4134341-Pleurochrysis_carterae.AAC.1
MSVRVYEWLRVILRVSLSVIIVGVSLPASLQELQLHHDGLRRRRKPVLSQELKNECCQEIAGASSVHAKSPYACASH